KVLNGKGTHSDEMFNPDQPLLSLLFPLQMGAGITTGKEILVS
ncbi:unnamed protein product, partial [marine sediment metagenome]